MMYRFLIFSIFSLGIVSLNSLYAQDTCKCDYIDSGYYQLIYEAEIAYLEENDHLAYEKLQQAEKTCTLLNQTFYREMEKYGMLLLKNENFDKAIHYMEKLATEYGIMPGYILSVLEKDSVLTSNLLMKYPAFNDSILPAIMQKCNEFYTPECKQLVAELTDILKSDQDVRIYSEKANETAFAAKLEKTDTLNAKRFFEIIKKQGYPTMKQYGDNMSLSIGINELILHISDHCDIKEKMLQYVREGKCDPLLYGVIVDRNTKIRSLMLTQGREGKIVYAAYDNAKDNEIVDIEHLDERRIAIGMPTREMYKRRVKLIAKRNE
jgi:hypothetical protein